MLEMGGSVVDAFEEGAVAFPKPSEIVGVFGLVEVEVDGVVIGSAIYESLQLLESKYYLKFIDEIGRLI